MKLEGRHFLISGGASGLGKGAAIALIRKGAKVTIIDRDDETGAEVCKELGDNCTFVQADLLEEETIKEAFGKLKWPEVHGLVNCAGTGLATQVLNKKGRTHDLIGYDFLCKLNLTGNFSLCVKAAEKMSKNEPIDGERGAIINVASIAAFDGQTGQCAYAATKGGIVAMTLPMARDLGKFGIRVNTIAPGVFSTPLTAGFDVEGHKVGDGLKRQQVFPDHRFGQPHEFGHIVIFLMENSFMNGESIRIDGGVRMPKM